MKRNEFTKTCNRPAPTEGLPESPELERAVLGALILEPDQLPDVAEIVEISAFVDAKNGKIYGEMLSMLERGDKIDLYTLSQRPELKDRDMLRYFSELTSAVGSGVNVLDHARQLADTETRRRLCLFGYELAARAVSDPDGVVDWATSEITAIADRVSRPDDIAPLSDVVRATLDDLERRQQARQAGECIGIPSGQLAGRMLVGSSGVDSGAFRTGNVDASGWTKIETAGATLSTMPIFLNDSANITIGAIRSQCKAMHRRGKCGMVIIDYLQLLDTSTRNPNSTREREIAAASRAAKLLAKELNIPVIMLSQLSRKVEERADKTPLLSDLRESGAIEQDADMVAFIDRPAMYGAQMITTTRYGLISSEGVGVLHIAKNREGAAGRIYFRHNESLTRITDYENTAADTTGEAEPF